jgi:transposase
VDVEPECCQGCGHSFPSASLPRRRKWRCHQVAELPPLRPHVTEYRLYARRCRDCGKRTWATLPTGVARRCVGPRAQAVLALLAGACRLSRRQVQSLAQDVFGIGLSLGTLVALEADTAAALATPYQEVAAAVVQEPVLFVDETSWREAGVLHWLWAVVSRPYVYYRLDRHRNREACRTLLAGMETGPAPPCVTTDRYGVYSYLDPEQRSFCWAHLLREFLGMAARSGVDAGVAHWLLDRMGGVLTHWHAFQAGELNREQFLAAVEPLREGFRAPLEWGRQRGSRRTQALCRALWGNWESLWAWQTVEGGEPTNNTAERALRPAVLWRKSSFGHQSEAGKQFVERLLTVVGTLRQQGRNVWEYLVVACTASHYGQPAPTLLKQLPT